MRLITEQNFNDIEYLVEETKTGTKQMFIEGPFIQTKKKNRNNRIYDDKIMIPVIDKYIQEQVVTGRALGELMHPAQRATVDLDRVSHRITELNWHGDDVYGKALILNTPTGNIVRGLLEGGAKLGVSSRGMGSLEKRNGVDYVKDDFMLSTVDIVADPSAPDAFVNGILEGVEFIYDANGKLIEVELEAFEQKAVQKIKKSKSFNESQQLRALQRFLSNL